MKKIHKSAFQFRKEVLEDYPQLVRRLKHPLDAIVTLATELDAMELGQRGRVGLWREWRLSITKVLDILSEEQEERESFDDWTQRFIAGG